MTDSLAQLKNNKTLVSICRDNIDANKIHGFILDYSKNFILLHHVYDFHLDGLLVLRINDITEICSNKTDAFQTQLLKDEGLFDQIDFNVGCNLKSWKTILTSLAKNKVYLIIEDENPEYPIFLIGKLSKILNDNVSLLGFSGAGNWDEDESVMYYEDISSLQVNNNYIEFYKRFYERQP